MSLAENTQNYGIKAANLMYVKANYPEISIPNFTAKSPSDGIETILSDFNAMKKPVIVRSSPRQDYDGVFESVPRVYDEQQLARAVRRVEESARTDRAKAHAVLRGQTPDEEMPILVQEQSSPGYLGGVVQFPNNPSQIYVCYHDTGSSRWRRDNSSILFDTTTRDKVRMNRVLMSDGISREVGNEIVEHYEKIQSLWPEQSLILEFGYSPFELFEVKFFKPIETTDFEVPMLDYDRQNNERTDFVFGITPPEGIVLPVVKGIGYGMDAEVIRASRVNDLNLHAEHDYDLYIRLFELCEDWGGIQNPRSVGRWAEAMKERHSRLAEAIGGPYAFVTTTTRHDDGFDLDLTLPNMSAIVLGKTDYFLTHDMMRTFRRADITFGLPIIGHPRDMYANLESVSDRVRIISNGKEATIMKE